MAYAENVTKIYGALEIVLQNVSNLTQTYYRNH
jgi:hypothetical protein